MNKTLQTKNRVYSPPLSKVFTIESQGVLAVSGEDFFNKDLSPMAPFFTYEEDDCCTDY